MTRAFLALTLLALPLGCARPCADDGLGQKKCPDQSSDADSGSGSATDGTDASGSGSGSASGSASNSGTVGSASASGTGTGSTTSSSASASASSSTSGSASDSNSGTGGPGCDNGVQDGDETDVDCGGSCAPCPDGKVCSNADDCVSMMCVDQVCGDPVCGDEVDDNTCQSCLKANCCEKLVDCFQDTYCACWFACIQHNNDFEPCKTQCMGNMSPGEVTSCANSECNFVGACGS